MSYQIETWIGQALIVGGFVMVAAPIARALIRDMARRWRHGR